MTIEEYKRRKIEEYFDEKQHALNENVKTRRLSQNTVCEITGMTYEEYLKKTGYHTYSEIKKRLGL